MEATTRSQVVSAMQNNPNRFSAFRTRLALVIVGLALGFAARWVGGLIDRQVKEPHFQPMPATESEAASETGSDKAKSNQPREQNGRGPR